MTLTILDDSISSDRSPHTARLGPNDWRAWEVSWLPGRQVDRNSAITAMALADLAGSGELHVGHPFWPHVEGWAAELTLTAPEALTQIASSPTWGEGRHSAAPDDPEAAG
jgi:hypothetical protein